MSPTHHNYSRRLESCDTIFSRIKFLFTEDQEITHITIPNALMTAWVGDLFGKDIMYGTGIAA
jgi:hypothetical protein